MFKKLLSAAAAIALGLLPACAATAETTFEGTVVEGSSISVTAPFGGIIDTFSLREGGVISAGDIIATVETTKVYAPADGTVTGLFAQPGDSLEDVQTRYGAALYIMPQNKYQIEADVQYAYNATENKYVTIGETVYLSCTVNGSHTGVGTITAVSGTTFTVEVTSGELLMEEEMNVYRDSGYAYKTRIGRGDVARISENAVNGTGSLLYLHVKDGDPVQRGQLLFETVTGGLDGLYATSNQIVSSVSGIIAKVNVAAGSSVNKGDALLTIYPQDSLLIQIDISEYDLGSLAEGDKATFTLNYQEGEQTVYEGQLSMISYLSGEDSGEIKYKGYISFQGNENVRLGMTAAVTVE